MEGKDIFSIVATTISVAAAVLSAAAMIIRATKKPENEQQPNAYCYSNANNGYYNNNYDYTRRYYNQPQYVNSQPVSTPIVSTTTPVPTPSAHTPVQQTTEELKWNDCTSGNTVQNNAQFQTTNPWANTGMMNVGNVWPTYSYGGYYKDITMPNTTPVMYYNQTPTPNYNYTNYGYGYSNTYQYPYGYGYSYGYEYPNIQSYQIQQPNVRYTPYTETIVVPGCKNQTWVGKSNIVFDNYCQKDTTRNEDIGELKCENKPDKLMPIDDPNDEIIPMFDTPSIKQTKCNNIAI